MGEMKNSGIEWIGNIPNNWKCCFSKYYIHISNGSDPKTEGVTPVYGSGEDSFKTCGEYKEGPAVLLGRKGTIGIPRWIEEKYWNVDTAFDVRVKENFNLRYYYYLSTCFDYKLYMTQTALPSMRQSDYENMYIPFPPLPEQSRIASFLDDRCAKIDEAIKRCKEMNGKLDEYRKAVITKAVTKGVRGEREMKESGIEWIGYYPEVWTSVRIKYLADKLPNSFVDGDWIESPYITDSGIRYLTTGNIGDGYFKRQGDGYITIETFIDLSCKYVYPGDLIISRLNAPFGRSCILPSDEDKYIIAVDNVILRTQHNKKYICYVTQCMGYQQVVEEFSRGTAMQRISRTNLGNISIPIPPISEQNEIVSFLDKRCAEIDAAKEKNENMVKKLEEYKKSLIYHAVTGKIEC